MTRVHKAKACEAKKFAKPDDIISVKICTKCGNLAVPDYVRMLWAVRPCAKSILQREHSLYKIVLVM